MNIAIPGERPYAFPNELPPDLGRYLVRTRSGLITTARFALIGTRCGWISEVHRGQVVHEVEAYATMDQLCVPESGSSVKMEGV